MRKMYPIIALILILVLTVTLLASCDDEQQPPEDDVPANTTASNPVLNGKFIVAKASCKGGDNAKKMIDNSGMSGLETSSHLHSSNARDMFLQTGKEPMVFTFDEPTALGNLYIWNYNAEGALNSGIKEAKIEYSYDGENWTALGKDGLITLNRALESENETYGGNSANNVGEKRDPIAFDGIVAKAVRITPISNYGEAADCYGLSEVRFFRHKIRPKNGSLLPAISTSPLAENLTGYGENIVSGAALTKNGETITAGNDPSRMWCVNSQEEAMSIIDLDGTYPISALTFWNYNDPNALNNGIQELKIEYTVLEPYTNNDDGSINYNSGNWTTLGTYTLQQGDGSAQLAPSLQIDLQDQDIHAQHIRITAISNYGGSGFGLAGMTATCGSGWAVEPSRQWTGLFSSVGTYPYQISGVGGSYAQGWLLADGIYTLNLDGGDMMGSLKTNDTTLFVFSDTLMGNFNNYSGTYGMYSFGMANRAMVNHSFAILQGSDPDPRNIQFYMHTASGEGNIIPIREWVQELIKIDNKIYCFGMQFGDDWGADSWDLVSFPFDKENSTVDFSNAPTVVENIPIRTEVDGYTYDYSAAALDNTVSGGATPSPDGYIYIYGIKGGWLFKQAIVARVTPEEFADTSKWRYWNGSDWVEDIKESAELASEAVVSSEYSVSYMTSGLHEGKYVMNITRGSMSSCLQMAFSDSLTGTFDNFTSIYCCDELYDYPAINGDTGFYTYNAKAHPNLSAEGELLISYNLNSANFDRNLSHQYLHPHFVTYFEID